MDILSVYRAYKMYVEIEFFWRGFVLINPGKRPTQLTVLYEIYKVGKKQKDEQITIIGCEMGLIKKIIFIVTS